MKTPTSQTGAADSAKNLLRVITVCWPDIEPAHKRKLLLFGGRVQAGRHFRGVRAHSLDILTASGSLTVGTCGVHRMGRTWSERVGWWALLTSPIRGITVHASPLGLLAITPCAEHRARQLQALESAAV